MGYRDSEALDMQRKIDNIDQCYQVALKPLNIPPPVLIDAEPLHKQRKRIMEKCAHSFLTSFKKLELMMLSVLRIKITSKGDLWNQQRRKPSPSKVPEGELKQVTRYDAFWQTIL